MLAGALLHVVTCAQPGSTSSFDRARAMFGAALPTYSGMEICALAGRVARDEQEDADLVLAEFKRRRLRIDQALARARSVRIGATTCDMHAALGAPDRTHTLQQGGRTTSQHVYGGTNVYSVNGVVTAIQD